MSGSNPSLVRSIAWVLLVALVGVYLLYDWHSGRLSAQLDQKEADILAAVAQIKEREARIGSIQGEVAQLNEHIRELADLHAGERQQLEDRIAASEQTKAQLEEAIETLRQTDAGTLAAEQAKAAAAIEERDREIAAFKALQGQYEMAVAKADSLRAELTGLQQLIADSALEHRQQIEALERHLNERVQLAKATPKDTELMRAAQAAGLLPEAVAPDEEAAALADRLAETQAALQAQQAESEAAREMQSARIAALEEDLKTARAALAEPSPQDASEEVLAALRERLAQTEAGLAKARSEAAAALEAAGTTTARQLVEAEARIAALSEQLASEQAARTRIATETEAAAAELKEALARTETELAEVRTQLSRARQAAESAGNELLTQARTRIAALEAAIEEERGKSAQVRSSMREEADRMLAELRGLYRRFSELGGTYTDRGMLLKLANTELRFQPAMATLTSDDLPSLDRIAELLVAHPNLDVRIEGHTDSQGDAMTNLALSQQRAEAVKQALVQRGVAASRLTAEGLGPERAIADNATPAGRAQNRRVEVYVVEG
jgi:outer membrane protein OmpA-like peptidoglycan-associated protein